MVYLLTAKQTAYSVTVRVAAIHESSLLNQSFSRQLEKHHTRARKLQSLTAVDRRPRVRYATKRASRGTAFVAWLLGGAGPLAHLLVGSGASFPWPVMGSELAARDSCRKVGKPEPVVVSGEGRLCWIMAAACAVSPGADSDPAFGPVAGAGLERTLGSLDARVSTCCHGRWPWPTFG